jgi:enoyl-CoA hydratase/carnithine racemase
MITDGSGDTDDLLVTLHDGWAEARLNRPHKRNALSWALAERLVRTLTEIQESGRTAAVLAANGPIFCAGGDLEDQRAGRPAPIAEVVHGMGDSGLFLIARVEGPVVGGGISLLTPCPVVLATPNVEFTLPAAGLVGRFPAGFFAYLEGLIPPRAIVDHGVRSTPITAERAMTFGLVTNVVPPDRMDAEVAQWVQSVADRPKPAMQAAAYWRDLVAERIARPAEPLP